MESLTKPSKEIEEEVRKQLAPLFAAFQVGSPQYVMFGQHVRQLTERLRKSSDFLRTFVEALNICNSAQKTPSYSRVGAFIRTTGYLIFTEYVAENYVNPVILLLIAKGHDLHLEPDYRHRYTRHATSLEDLDSPALTLSIKLDFLELNGMPFFSKWIDRGLRNKIAHLGYEIEDSGNVFILEGDKRKKVDIARKLSLTIEYERAVGDLFIEQLSKFTSHGVPPKPRAR